MPEPKMRNPYDSDDVKNPYEGDDVRDPHQDGDMTNPDYGDEHRHNLEDIPATKPAPKPAPAKKV